MFILACVYFSFTVKMGCQRGLEWDHIVELHGYENNIRTKHWKCKYCQNEYIGSRTKIKAHLMGDKRKKIAECVQVLVEVIRMFSAAPSSAREGSSQHPILSHTLAQNVQQTLDT
jgi:NAD-dependent SIR2 family protein deacetylase